MPHKAQRPPGGNGRCGDQSIRGNGHPDLPPIATAPQAQTEIFIEHSAHSGVSVSLTRDRGRIIITCFGRVDGAWRAVGQAASLPSILLDSTIDALQALRDQVARDGDR